MLGGLGPFPRTGSAFDASFKTNSAGALKSTSGIVANRKVTPFWSDLMVAVGSGAIRLVTEEGQASIVSAERSSGRGLG